MRRSLFALFRGSDGRSLAWALAFLLVVNSFVAGAHAGFAAAEPGTVLCTIGHASGDDGSQGAHADPCCLAGCQVSPVGLDGPGAMPVGRTVAMSVSVLPLLALSVAAFLGASPHTARGPPLLA